MEKNTFSKIINCLKCSEEKRISDISKETGIVNITSIKSALQELQELSFVISKEQDNTTLYSLSTIIPLKRTDTYFGLNLSKEDENLINYLYNKIKQEWILETGKEPTKIQLQKTLAKIDSKFNFNLPIGWYMYGQVCVKIYNSNEIYNYNVDFIPKYVSNSLSIVNKFIKSIINKFSKLSINELKKESYRNNKLYLLKEEIWNIFSNLNEKELTDGYKEEIKNKLQEFLVGLIDKVDSKLYNNYYEFVTDYLDLTKDKDQIIFMEIYNLFWHIIALYNYKESLKNKYTIEELNSAFDNVILVNTNRFYEIITEFYDQYKSEDFINEEDIITREILQIMAKEEKDLKKQGKYTKELFDKKVFERINKKVC